MPESPESLRPTSTNTINLKTTSVRGKKKRQEKEEEEEKGEKKKDKKVVLNFYDSAALRQPVCIGEVSVTFFQKKKSSNVNFSIVFLLLFPSNQTEENR